MTHEQLEELIDKLNAGGDIFRIFLSELSETVKLSKIWMEEPIGNVAFEGSYDFFFINNEDGLYVAAVLDMKNDMHVLVKNEHRGNGYLATAMHKTIFPYLYQCGRKEQFVTYENREVGEYIKRCLGFELIDSEKAHKSLSEYSSIPAILPITRKVKKQEWSSIKTKIDRSRLYLEMAYEQLESILGKENDGGLRELANEIKYFNDGLLTFIENRQGSYVE